MKRLIIPAAALLIIPMACAQSVESETAITEVTTPQTETPVEISNKDKAVALLLSLESGDQTPVSYINPNKYVQHNLAVGDGLEGFGAVMQHAPEGGFKANVVRAFEDGNYVFTHTIYDFFGPKVGFDVFKFEDGLIVEHWDNLATVTPANPSGRTQTDGVTASIDLDKTEANKALVSDFLNTVLVNGQFDQMGKFFDGDNYLQHNSAVADGLSGLGAAIEEMAKNDVHMIYTSIHKVLGEGNFVLTISEGTFAGQPTSFYDLFRVENGLIAEHWDIIETILPASEHKNTNGKFNF